MDVGLLVVSREVIAAKGAIAVKVVFEGEETIVDKGVVTDVVGEEGPTLHVRLAIATS